MHTGILRFKPLDEFGLNCKRNETMKAVLWCFLLLIVLSLVSSGWEEAAFSVQACNYGKCLIVNTSMVAPISIGTFGIVLIAPNINEVIAYDRLLMTLTKSNPKLGEGVVNGTAIAKLWSNGAETSWQVAPDHPRNNKPNCVKIAKLSGETAVEIYDRYKISAELYVARAVNVLIHEAGIIGLSCGYFQPREACETKFGHVGRNWWYRCHRSFRDANQKWPVEWATHDDITLIDAFNKSGCRDAYTGPITRTKRVFIIAALWDFNYHHFLIDSLPRLARHVPFLRANPDIKFHIRLSTLHAAESDIHVGYRLRRQALELLGLSAERLVSGVVLADEVFLPRAVKCNYPLASAYEIRLLSSLLKKGAAQLHKPAVVAKPRPTLVIQQRVCMNVEECEGWRYWNDSATAAVRSAFAKALPRHKVVVHSSNDSSLSECLACQVALYSRTHVLVGLHGAGLTNMMFMPPGGLVVEITGRFDGIMLPLCGYYGGLAAVFGLHHYVYYYDDLGGERLDASAVANEAAQFWRFLSK